MLLHVASTECKTLKGERRLINGSHGICCYLRLLRNARSKCECAHTVRVGMVMVVRLYIYVTVSEKRAHFGHKRIFQYKRFKSA